VTGHWLAWQGWPAGGWQKRGDADSERISSTLAPVGHGHGDRRRWRPGDARKAPDPPTAGLFLVERGPAVHPSRVGVGHCRRGAARDIGVVGFGDLPDGGRPRLQPLTGHGDSPGRLIWRWALRGRPAVRTRPSISHNPAAAGGAPSCRCTVERDRHCAMPGGGRLRPEHGPRIGDWTPALVNAIPQCCCFPGRRPASGKQESTLSAPGSRVSARAAVIRGRTVARSLVECRANRWWASGTDPRRNPRRAGLTRETRCLPGGTRTSPSSSKPSRAGTPVGWCWSPVHRPEFKLGERATTRQAWAATHTGWCRRADGRCWCWLGHSSPP